MKAGKMVNDLSTFTDPFIAIVNQHDSVSFRFVICVYLVYLCSSVAYRFSIFISTTLRFHRVIAALCLCVFAVNLLRRCSQRGQFVRQCALLLGLGVQVADQLDIAVALRGLAAGKHAALDGNHDFGG